MNIAVRYCSTYGRTKAIAEEIAAELGVRAASIVDEPTLAEHVDVLFLGGAPYWSVMDPALEAYARSLNPAMVGRVVLFTTSNWSRRTAIGLRDILEKRGIAVQPGHFYAQMTQVEQRKPAARWFARAAVQEIANDHGKPTQTGLAPELRIEALTVGSLVAGLVATGLLIAFFHKRSKR